MKSPPLVLMKMQQNKRIENRDILDLKQVAEYINVSTGTIENWIRREGFPAMKAGKLLRFFRSEVNDWLKQRRVKHGII
jgi:excisionase family DNA binding protein